MYNRANINHQHIYIYIYILGLVRLGGGVRLEGALERLLLRGLGLHQLLEALLLLGLVDVGLLEVGGEAVVHALEDALDLGGLRRVVAERVVGDLHGRDLVGLAAADEVLGLVHEAAHHLEVL